MLTHPQLHQNFDNTVFIEADFIYWNVNQEGTVYATSGNSYGGADNFIPAPEGKVYRTPSKMAPGFKVALGVNLNKDLWDTLLRYTYIHSHTTSSTPYIPNHQNSENSLSLTTPLNRIRPTFFASSFENNNQATTDFTLHFNALDAELGKTLYPSDSFTLRPCVGLKGVWTKESNTITSTYSSLVNFSEEETVLVTNTETSPTTQYCWGLGPRIGVSGIWALYKNYLGLFGETAFSALWSRVKGYYPLYYTAHPTAPGRQSLSDFPQEKNTYKMHTLIPVFELSLGLQTEWVFSNGGRFLASAAWETQMFLFMNQRASAIPDISLNMEGLTLKFRYDF